MKNKILLTSLLAFIVLQNLMSQNICDFDDNFSSFTQIDWDALENEEVLYRDWVADCNGCVGNATILTVVHVFYTNEQEIIDAATIQLAIDKINSDLSGGLGGFDTGI